MRILVTGGARSGKSRHAARLAASHGGPAPVTFVAPGRPADEFHDADWAARVAHHRAHRPSDWLTLETPDVAGALRETRGPVLVDCLGTWLTGTVDALGLWDAPADEVRAAIDGRAAELRDAVADRVGTAAGPDTVLVTNEVGSGVVPAHRSGGVFRDLLGSLNQTVAEACDEVHLVVCGRALVL